MNFKEAGQLLTTYSDPTGGWHLHDGLSLLFSDLNIDHIISKEDPIYPGDMVLSLSLSKVVMPGEVIDRHMDILEKETLFLSIGGKRIPIRINNLFLELPVIDIQIIEDPGPISIPTEGRVSIAAMCFEHDFKKVYTKITLLFKKQEEDGDGELIQSRFDILDL